MTLLHTYSWLIVPVLVIIGIIYYAVKEGKARTKQRQAWRVLAVANGGTFAGDRRRMEMQIPIGSVTLTVDTYSVTHSTGGEGASSHTEHYTRFRIPCAPAAPLRFALIERTPGLALSKSVARRIDKRPNSGADLPEIALGDPAFDRVFLLSADPPATAGALLTPLASKLSALRYVIWQYNALSQAGAVATALTTDLAQIGRRRSSSASKTPELPWLLWATVSGRITDEDEFQVIVATLTALYEEMRRQGIVADSS